jgi:Ca2+/Na+ antiporter
MGVVLWLAAFVAGIALLERGADAFTDRIGALARRWRAPESLALGG